MHAETRQCGENGLDRLALRAGQRERLVAKFDALAEPVLGAARARELRAAILGLDRLDNAGAVARLAERRGLERYTVACGKTGSISS